MANQQTAPVMLDDELRANMTHEEQIQHLEALIRRVRDQWQADHREHLQRSNNQEREITRLCDELQASRDEAAHAWSLVPDARQREEIEKRTNWSTHVDPASGGTSIVAECRFRNSHFHVTDLISKEGLEKGEDAIEFQINDATQRLRRGIMAGACKELGIRTEEQEQQAQGESDQDPIAILSRQVIPGHPEASTDWFDHNPLEPFSRQHMHRENDKGWELIAVHCGPPAPAAVPEEIVKACVDAGWEEYEERHRKRPAMIAGNCRAAMRKAVEVYQHLAAAPAAVPEQDPENPITWLDRFVQALTLITGARPPKRLAFDWVIHKSDALQDWVGETSAPWWLQNIGAIDAAQAMADNPIEGEPTIVDYAAPAPAEQTETESLDVPPDIEMPPLESAPNWRPCNPACDPEFGGYMDSFCIRSGCQKDKPQPQRCPTHEKGDSHQ